MKKGFFDKNDGQWVIPIADKHGNYLDLRKGRVHTARHKYDIKEKIRFKVKRTLWCQQSDEPEKIIILEEIEWESNKKTELRIGYYTTSKTGHWWWGQFALMIPQKDLEELLRYGREKGFLSY
jgi:hypothetical protein